MLCVCIFICLLSVGLLALIGAGLILLLDIVLWLCFVGYGLDGCFVASVVGFLLRFTLFDWWGGLLQVRVLVFAVL